MYFVDRAAKFGFRVRYLRALPEIKTLEPASGGVAEGSSLRRGGVYLISGMGQRVSGFRTLLC